MKKFLTMFLIILLCVSAFSGCDNVLPQNGGSQTTDSFDTSEEDHEIPNDPDSIDSPSDQ